ncbi:MAG: SMP-30/gluconolactonase/LRE family protein [Acidobacteriia bacterium]|nr:SMP-30/gluconolactonase/LRE family protein [Terriglobia bacterium]
MAWEPSPDPGYTRQVGPGEIRSLPEAGAGPEAVAIGPDGSLYTGLQDGRVVRLRPDGASETFVQTGGRPLGMKFDRSGRLLMADAFRGLLAVAPDRSLTVLADSVNGRRMLFPNDLDIVQDGGIWFSDTSQRFDQRHWMAEFWEGRATGRLLHYDPRTRRVEVKLDGLRFANGVALGPDEAFVLVNETTAARITRLWLKGPRAGQRETFATLPGYPDNLTYNGRGIFWVALATPRVKALEMLAGWPRVRRALFRIPAAIRDPKPGRMAWVIGLDAEGRTVREWQDPAGRFGSLASAVESAGRLYVGSIQTSSVGWLEAPGR